MKKALVLEEFEFAKVCEIHDGRFNTCHEFLHGELLLGGFCFDKCD